MKKLKLKAFQGNALSREQLKKVLGGVSGSGDSGSGTNPTATCVAQCETRTLTCYSYSELGCFAGDGTGCTGHDSRGTQYILRC